MRFITFITRRKGARPRKPTVPAAPGVSLALDGNPSFTIADLDNTTLYEGATQRTWYQRLLNAMAGGYADSAMALNDWYEWGRIGRPAVTTYLWAFRVTGDLALLDECVRLFEIAWANRNASDLWTGNDIALEWNSCSGLFGPLTYVLERNRALTSPAGYNYGTLADKYWTWIGDTFIPHMRNSSAGVLPLRSPTSSGAQHHTYSQLTAFHWYMSRTLDLRGGTLSGNTAAEWKTAAQTMLTSLLTTHSTGVTAYNDRTVRLYNHLAVPGWGSAATGDVIQYTTYHAAEFAFYLDMETEGMDSRVDETLLTQLANGFSDLVCDDELNVDPLARTLAGDRTDGETILGLTINATFRGRVNKEQTVRAPFPLMAAYDSKNHIGPYLFANYPYAGTLESPQYPMYPACAVWLLNEELSA